MGLARSRRIRRSPLLGACMRSAPNRPPPSSANRLVIATPSTICRRDSPLPSRHRRLPRRRPRTAHAAHSTRRMSSGAGRPPSRSAASRNRPAALPRRRPRLGVPLAHLYWQQGDAVAAIALARQLTESNPNRSNTGIGSGALPRKNLMTTYILLVILEDGQAEPKRGARSASVTLRRTREDDPDDEPPQATSFKLEYSAMNCSQEAHFLGKAL